MAFDIARFLKTRWTPRTAEIDVPDMQEFFPEGEKPAWKVRGLEGIELGRANDAAARNKDVAAIVGKLIGGSDKDKAKAVQDLLGMGDHIPDDIAKRIEHFIIGSIDPPGSLELAKVICKAFPIEFFTITNKILELSGKGHVPGESKPSGEIPKSEPV